jgi:hypothetical protein
MTCRLVRTAAALGAVLFAALTGLAQEGAAPSPEATPAKSQGIEARLRIGAKAPQRVVLLGRKDGKVVYRFADSAQMVSSVATAEVTSVRLNLAIDKAAVAKAQRRGDWATAGTILGRALVPALPFLDLKDNNALSSVLRAGTCFLLAAEQKTGCRFDAEARVVAEQEYLYAYAMFKSAMSAEWSARADAARMLAAISLVGLRRTPEAAELLSGLSEPEVADEDCGLYRLASAEVLNAQGNTAAALEAAVSGLAFADKDIDTFPISLMLSAYCYAKLGDPYRARDVYYEVARLFAGTHWEVAARAALRQIVDTGLTKIPEAVAAKAAFFGTDEDVNAKVAALLDPATAATPTATGKVLPAPKPAAPAGVAPREGATGAGAAAEAALPDARKPADQETPKP